MSPREARPDRRPQAGRRPLVALKKEREREEKKKGTAEDCQTVRTSPREKKRGSAQFPLPHSEGATASLFCVLYFFVSFSLLYLFALASRAGLARIARQEEDAHK